MADTPLLQVVSTLNDLKALKTDTPNQTVLLIGKTTSTDGKGGFYRWDNTDTTTAEDTVYMNTVVSTVAGAAGRWIRIFQKARSVAGGVLVNNGGVKSFYAPATTNSTGKATLNLTEDGTATGTPLFNEIWSITPSPQTNAAGPADAVQSYRESLTTDLKTVVYGFYKANAVTIALGMFLTPVASIGSGTVVQFRIDGT